MDYQNVMLGGHKIFAPDTPLHTKVIDPYRFACQVAQAKNATLESDRHCSPTRVEVYRGCPSQKHDIKGYSRNQAQKSRWIVGHQDQVSVEYRPLKYYPDGLVKEKGIDVLTALALVRAARSGLYDVVVLASRDTDLAPALDEAYSVKAAVTKIEAVKWYNPEDRTTDGRIKTKSNIWTTNLFYSEWEASLDPHHYS